MDTRLHVLGEEHSMVIVMIHGTGMSWDMLMNSAEILQEKYCVVLVSVPGHDPNTTEEFTSVEQIAGEIETGLIEMGRSSVDLLYGLSMGGGIAIRILADNRLSVKHAVIDAGITPYEMPWMSSFEIHDCSVSGTIVGGDEYTSEVVGDPACAVSVDCQSDINITEAASDAA